MASCESRPPFFYMRIFSMVFQLRVVTVCPNSLSRTFISSVVPNLGESVMAVHTSVEVMRTIAPCSILGLPIIGLRVRNVTYSLVSGVMRMPLKGSAFFQLLELLQRAHNDADLVTKRLPRLCFDLGGDRLRARLRCFDIHVAAYQHGSAIAKPKRFKRLLQRVHLDQLVAADVDAAQERDVGWHGAKAPWLHYFSRRRWSAG